MHYTYKNDEVILKKAILSLHGLLFEFKEISFKNEDELHNYLKSLNL